MRAGSEYEARGLSWIARLPLCGERELGALLGIDPLDARPLVHGLVRGGWVETVEPGSPELELRRLAFVRDDALPAMADACGISAGELPAALPTRLRDTLERLARVEITVGVSSFLAGLAAAVRRERLGGLVDARSLPLALPAARRWWLPGTHGYGCLRAGALWAPFLVAWDRADAPDKHRRRQVAAWSKAVSGSTTHSEEALPLMLVCPSATHEDAWEVALAGYQSRGLPLPELWLTTREELLVAGLEGAGWRRPSHDHDVPLVEAIGWGEAPAISTVAFPRSFGNGARPAGRTPLRAWAARLPPAEAAMPRWQHVGALAVATSLQEKVLIEWVARHPLLSASELARLLDEPRPVIERRLGFLEQRGSVHGALDDRRKLGSSEERYLATALAVRFLADRAGTSASLFAQDGGVTYLESGGQRDSRIVHHREHTLGVNRFFSQLASGARATGWRLAEWRNEAESTHRFVAADGVASWIRPDGSGVLTRDGVTRPFLLEYDRGTLDAGDYRAKFAGYRRYYAAREWRHHYESEPLLLFVCIDDRAERRVRQAVDRSSLDLPFRAVVEWPLEPARIPTWLLPYRIPEPTAGRGPRRPGGH